MFLSQKGLKLIFFVTLSSVLTTSIRGAVKMRSRLLFLSSPSERFLHKDFSSVAIDARFNNIVTEELELDATKGDRSLICPTERKEGGRGR